MKRQLIALLAPLLIATSAAAESTEEIVLNERMITVSTSASGEYEPDAVAVTLAIETQAKSAIEASKENARRADEVVRALTRLLGPGDPVSTASYSVFPLYEYDKLRKETLAGFRVLNQVHVRTKKIKSAGEVIDRAIEAGANRVSEVSFVISDTGAACEELLAKASAAALKRAKLLTEAFGARLGAVKQIAPRCSAEAPPPVRPFLMEAAKAAATPIEPGGVEVNATVEAIFYIVSEE